MQKSVLLLPLSHLFITSTPPPKMLLSRKAGFFLLSSELFKVLHVTRGFPAQLATILHMFNSLYATGLLCLAHTGLESLDRHLPKDALCFTSFPPLGESRAWPPPKLKSCSEMALGQVTRNSCKRRAIIITLGTVTYILEQMLDKVQTAFTA